MPDAAADGGAARDVSGPEKPADRRAGLPRLAAEQRGADRVSSGKPVVRMAPGLGGAEPARAAFLRHWVFRNPAWDSWSFDFDRHLAMADERVGRWSIRSIQTSPRSRLAGARPSCIQAGRIRSSTRSTRSRTTSRCDRARSRSRRPTGSSGCSWCPEWAIAPGAPARRTSATRTHRRPFSMPSTISCQLSTPGSTKPPRRRGSSPPGSSMALRFARDPCARIPLKATCRHRQHRRRGQLRVPIAGAVIAAGQHAA